MLKEGQPAPDFKLLNDRSAEVNLSDFRGKHVVLYFYPRDNTSGCTKEACGFRDLQAEFEKHNAVILGVSPDSVKSHQNFSGKYSLPFQLLSDENKEVVQRYDVWKEKSMYGKKYMGVERTTFVIDKDGMIKKIYPKVKVPQHPEAVLEFVQGLEAA
ncbi:thioredoxin-dependent thiol peroxidase [candidate division KSB1 bacterium]|nr:thioredoxin-dependent thiol peroxidase [candidate division KSB1 bacterium]NIR71138.1 thioredoxin-dependent thiol peroxidase [candidate division KSB1 bacterium]NIS24776.1 thioredoxin-dependent thiol peroxidase [candidate division KSB1 bacterium]NIT71684.1 thioredoxin-dependent thiol peroxidase [candidate division KSB1 bacterium]NIU25390.1 thioredoxin-dependent thiol peroxidase [candidate division KSB1 bacterium]